MAGITNPMMQQGAGVPSGQLPAPNAQADLDKQRVALLLEINTHLLTSIQALQAAGKGGDVQSPAQGSAADGPSDVKKPSREYVEPLRRMQANLAYLANLAERHQKPNQQQHPWPQVMTAPPGDETLAPMYAQLQTLFPQWKLQQQRMAAAQAAQAQQAAGGMQNTSGPMGAQGQGQMMGGGMGQHGGSGEQGMTEEGLIISRLSQRQKQLMCVIMRKVT